MAVPENGVGGGPWLALVALLAASGAPAYGGETGGGEAAHELHELALTDRGKFVERVTSGAGSDHDRAAAITEWFARNFDWTATDYQQRTVQQILERKGGNCAELARVTTAMLEELGLPFRRMREINLHVESEERQRSAIARVAERGNRLSVFGRLHNDHVWIEIQDRATGEWFPADPSLGVVGNDAWLSARLGFGERYSLDPTSVDMIAPFAVFAADAKGRLVENRTRFYVIDGFDRLYDGQLHTLPAWPDWVRLVDELDDRALAAFRGETNLHDSGALIESLAATYELLRRQYATPRSSG